MADAAQQRPRRPPPPPPPPLAARGPRHGAAQTLNIPPPPPYTAPAAGVLDVVDLTDGDAAQREPSRMAYGAANTAHPSGGYAPLQNMSSQQVSQQADPQTTSPPSLVSPAERFSHAVRAVTDASIAASAVAALEANAEALPSSRPPVRSNGRLESFSAAPIGPGAREQDRLQHVNGAQRMQDAQRLQLPVHDQSRERGNYQIDDEDDDDDEEEDDEDDDDDDDDDDDRDLVDDRGNMLNSGADAGLQDPPSDVDDADSASQPYGRPSEELARVRELEEYDDANQTHAMSSRARTKAKCHASSTVRVSHKLAHNVLNKLEDVGIGLLGVTEGLAEAGEGVGRVGLSGVNVVGSVVEAGVSSFLDHGKDAKMFAREVDTVTEVDISGTIVRDLNRQIEMEQLKGTSNAESPLNTPWILLIFPILPIAVMYTKVMLVAIMPYLWRAAERLWTFFGWRFWFCLYLVVCLGVVVFWDAVKQIGPLRSITMQLDVHVIKMKAAVGDMYLRQEPKVLKTLENLLPPFRDALLAADRAVSPRLGYSPLLLLHARYHGLVYDPLIGEIRVTVEGASDVESSSSSSAAGERSSAVQGSAQSVIGQLAAPLVGSAGEAAAAPPDRGHGRIIDEDGTQVREETSVQFDAQQASKDAEAAGIMHGPGEMHEQFFDVEICLKHLSEMHRNYTSVWIEWQHRGMVLDRSVIRSTRTGDDWKGIGASLDDYTLSGEVRLPVRADTTTAKGGFFDVPVKLILKGRDGLPLYSNDGARRYMRDSPEIFVIGEIEISALKIGVGADTKGIMRSVLRIPFHAPGKDNYRAAALYATGRFTPVDTSSYSYRQMLSPLPNGEWTIRINVFELRNLRGVDASLSSDPFVQVTTLGMQKRTDRQRKTLSCMVNQLLFFSRVCTGLEFGDERIVIEVMDWNRLGGSKKIGMYTLDARRVLELPGHELFRNWFALQDPGGGNRPAGFIKMSITVVPPGGMPPQHDDIEDKEEFTSATLLKNTVLRAPTMSYKNWGIHITIGWADMLPRMATPGYRDAVRGYMTFDYSGWDQLMTKTCIAVAKEVVDPNIGESCRVMPQRRVIWNEEYILPLTVVNDRVSQEGIHLKLFHRVMPRLQAPLREDQLIGQVNVSFFELFKNMCTAVVRGQRADNEDLGDRVRNVAMMKPRYYNFYGMPEGPADAYDKGVAFRGRVLIGVAAKPGYVSEPFLRPCPAPPRPKLEFYKVDFSILKATELPLPNGWSVYVECRIGLYSFGHSIPKVSVQNQCVQWDENCVVSIPNLQFPEDVDQIPDLFVTLFARKPSTVTVLEERMVTPGDEVPPVAQNGAGATGAVAADDAWMSHTEISAGPAAESHNGLDDAVGAGMQPANTANAASQDHDASAPGDVQDDDAEEVDEADDAISRILPASVTEGGDPKTWQPKAFLRLPAKNLVCGQAEPRWLFMDYPGNNVLDSSDTKVPGSLLVAASLSRFDPTVEQAVDDDVPGAVGSADLLLSSSIRLSPVRSRGQESMQAAGNETNTDAAGSHGDVATKLPRISDESQTLVPHPNRSMKMKSYSVPIGAERSYTLRALIFQGRNLPAADESGLSDPRVVVSMGNRFVPGKVYCKQTVAPQWHEMIEVRDIIIREGERKPNVNVIIYDYDDEDTPMKYLGRAIIPSSELDTVDPSLEFSEWYPCFSVNPGIMVGEILADFQLIPTEFARSHPLPVLSPPGRSLSALRIALVGLRDVKFLKYASGDIFVECSISGGSNQPIRSKRGAILQRRAFEANCNVLDVLVLDIHIPDDMRLAPALNVYVYAEYNHTQKEDMIATACIPLENWLREHERKLISGESLDDDKYGTETPIPKELVAMGYKFRRNRLKEVVDDDDAGAEDAIRLHEVKATTRSEQRQVRALRENAEVRLVGYGGEKERVKAKIAPSRTDAITGGKLDVVLAPIRAVKYAISDVLADLMPDVSQALGIEVGEDVPLSSLVGGADDEIDYDGTRALKRERGHCLRELEVDFCESAYGEFLLFRGDNRGLGNTTGRMAMSSNSSQGGASFPPLLPLDEAPSTSTLKKREVRRANLEGCRPAVGKVKARLDLIELDRHDDVDIRKVRLTSLRSFGRVFVPTEVVVRIYVLRGINLQQVGAKCNPYLTCRFYGGYPDFTSKKHDPVKDNDNPNFFEVFESRVKMPGGSVRIEVKDRILPELTVPLAYPFFIRDEGRNAFGMVHKEVPVSIGNLGLGWSELIGETVIDLDSRWYNSAWRGLKKTPVETRSLLTEDSSNMKGQLEVIVDIFDAKEVAAHPKMYRPIPIRKPPQEEFVMIVVIYKIAECMLPFILADNNPSKLATFYVQVRLGNKPEDERQTDRCKYVTDGAAEFNWRMRWNIKLPSLEIKPRLKLQIFDDTSMGMGNDQLCAVADVKLRSIFDDMVVGKNPIIKKKQWVTLSHPNHPEVAAKVQLSMELVTKETASKKKCLLGKEGYRTDQHPDYVLPQPFRPAAFSLYNPAPYFNYLIVSTVKNLQWQLATVLLLFPFIPMFMQVVFMHTPWYWYAAGGVSGLFIFVRIMLVEASKAARIQAEQDLPAGGGDGTDGGVDANIPTPLTPNE